MNSILKFFYKNKIGRIFRPIFTTHLTSKFIGWVANQSFSRLFIKPFINKYKIDLSEIVEPIGSYKTFNEFFYRKIKQDARTFDTDINNITSPADSCMLAIQALSNNSTFFVKECKFDIKKFLNNKTLATDYQNGSFLIFRLAPPDYHRFHFPFDCTPSSVEIISGKLESVNPIAYKSNVQPLTENERHLIRLNSSNFGQVLFIPVGAMCVGKIHETFQADKLYKKGDEMGFFAFGASSLVMIFKPNSIKINDEILQNSKNNIETQVKLGQCVAVKL